MTNGNGHARDKLTPKELASEIDVACITLARWRVKKIGPRYFREVNRIYYYRTDIEEWRAGNAWA